eukprot:3274505-Rhodomonas_salina.1
MLKIWDKLRQCCGMQLSRSYAEELRQNGLHNSSQQTQAHRCFGADTQALEASFLAQPLFRRCPAIRSVSSYDQAIAGDMDGHYCARSQVPCHPGPSAFMSCV